MHHESRREPPPSNTNASGDGFLPTWAAPMCSFKCERVHSPSNIKPHRSNGQAKLCSRACRVRFLLLLLAEAVFCEERDRVCILERRPFFSSGAHTAAPYSNFGSATVR